MKRGQAFDTMMLVISVIVALVILGILLNILGKILSPGQEPKELMQQDLKKVSTAGYGITNPKEADFKKDSVLDKQEIIGSVALLPEEVGFKCDGSFCTKVFGSITQTQKQVFVQTDSKANFVVCGSDSTKSNPKYCIGLGRNSADATNACLTLCKLK